MNKIQFVNKQNNTKTLYFAHFIYYKNEGAQHFNAYKKEMAATMAKYGIEEHLSIKVDEQEAITGTNTFEQPNEILIQKATNVDHFNNYIADEQYKASQPLLEKAVQRMTYVVGTEIERREMSSDSALEDRVYALGLLKYKPDGRQKLEEFNKKAIPLFMKHSFYADKFLDILDKGALVGEASDFTLPEELRIFWSDTAADLENYNSDPEYHAIKGIREEGVADYPTFLGKYKLEA